MGQKNSRKHSTGFHFPTLLSAGGSGTAFTTRRNQSLMRTSILRWVVTRFRTCRSHHRGILEK